MKEIWKDIPNCNGDYQASNLGRIKSFKKNKNGHILIPCLNNKGYYCVNLWVNKKQKTRTIHQLIAESFLDHKQCGYEKVVNHINHIKTDNRLKNLEIISQRENINLGFKNCSSKYPGVCWHKIDKRWTSRIHVDGKRIYLGSFKSELNAYLAYKKALEKLIKVK